MTAAGKARWEAIYRFRRPDEVPWFQREAQISLALVCRAAPDAGAVILDVGGGASTLVDGLLAAGYTHVSVLDISPSALAEARRRLGGDGADVVWVEGDVLTVDLPESAIDVWHDRAVFHFLTDPVERAQYVAQLRRALKPRGHAVMATFAHDGPASCTGFPVVRFTPDGLCGELGREFRLVESAREEHVTPAGATQAFVYCLFEREPLPAPAS
jgi:SAM-dependent methyltransferase